MAIKMDEQKNYDVFGYIRSTEGWFVTKNGDYFLTCSGTEKEARAIVDLLTKDSKAR